MSARDLLAAMHAMEGRGEAQDPPVTIDEQLGEDRILFGISIEERTADGQRRRLDPTTVRVSAVDYAWCGITRPEPEQLAKALDAKTFEAVWVGETTPDPEQLAAALLFPEGAVVEVIELPHAHGRPIPGYPQEPTLCGEPGPVVELVGEVTCPNCVAIAGDLEQLVARVKALGAKYGDPAPRPVEAP
jgi:hypothetical protein